MRCSNSLSLEHKVRMGLENLFPPKTCHIRVRSELTILLLHESLQTSAEEFVVFLDDIKESADLRQSMTELLEFTENRVFAARQSRLFALLDVALIFVQFLLHHGVGISVQ